jgi:hypothetical protein
MGKGWRSGRKCNTLMGMGTYRHPNYCRCGRCRREIAQFESGLLTYDLIAITVMLLIAGIMWVAAAPLRIWHVTGSDGQEHPDTATWIAYGTSGAVIVGALVFFSCRSARAGRRTS